MKILILEDEEFFQNKIIEIIKNSLSTAKIKVCKNITECKKNNTYFTLGIIDISLPDGDGIEYIKENHNHFDFIIFLTSMENRVFDAFGENVVGFILKDEMQETLPAKLKEITKKANTKKLILKTDKGIIHIPSQDIIYIQTESRDIRIFSKETYLLKRQGIKEFSKQLSSRFVWINQSTIINLDYVSSWKKDEIILNDTFKVFASRNYLKPALHKFIESRDEL